MAGSMNKVILIGNLGADPEIREMSDGTKMAKFSIATSEKYTNRDGQLISNTDWHNIVLWRRTAEVAEKYLKKGDSVCIEGKLKTRSWDDENGNKRYATDVQGDNMTMLGSRRDANNTESSYSASSLDNKENAHTGPNTESIDNLPFEDNKTPF